MLCYSILPQNISGNVLKEVFMLYLYKPARAFKLRFPTCSVTPSSSSSSPTGATGLPGWLLAALLAASGDSERGTEGVFWEDPASSRSGSELSDVLGEGTSLSESGPSDLLEGLPLEESVKLEKPWFFKI